MRKVRIKGLPQASQGGSTSSSEGLSRFFGGGNTSDRSINQFGEPDFEVNKSIKAVDPAKANIEAEGGEFAVVPGQSGIPEAYKINGPRHGAGGVPLNLAEDSFIFSDFKKEMKIKDKDILAEFGASVPKKGKPKGKTPADLAKKFDLNEYKKILLDPNSDMLERDTAERMITNYNMKLGKLALVQESIKGFPQEIPAIAMPYLQKINQDPKQFAGEEMMTPAMAAYGAGVVGDPSQYSYRDGGEMSKRFPGLEIAQRGGVFEGAFWKSVMQDGGPVRDDQYQTYTDFNAETPAAFNDLTNAPAPKVMTEGEIITKFGTKAEKEAWANKVKTDAAALGMDPAAYVAQELYELTPEELDRAEAEMASFNINGVHWRSIRKELAREENAANRNGTGRLKLVDPATGQIVKDELNPKEVEAYKAVADKTIGNNVKTSDKVYNYDEEALKDAVIHDFNDKYDNKKSKVGDYIKHPDGRIQKITGKTRTKKKTSASGPENYVPKNGSIEADVEAVKEILARNTTNGSFVKGTEGPNKGKWLTKRGAANTLSVAEKDLITRVSQYRGTKKDLGALDLHFGTQSSGGDMFYGFVDGELLEYKYWQANNPNGTPEQFEQLDHQDLINNRKEYLEVVGGYLPEEVTQLEEEGRLVTPGDLYTKDFLKGDKDKPGFTKRLQESFGETEGFLDAHGADSKIGMDHVDNFEIGLEEKYKDVKEKEQIADGPKKGLDQVYEESSTAAPWWAQDVGNMLMTVGERASLKKYLPHSFPVDLAKPDVVYYDPSRALAANAEQANIAAQTLGSYANSQQASSQLQGIQGQAFANAANTLADYEAKNVGIGNQYLDKVQRTLNEETLGNSKRMQQLYDQTTVANQQFDNSKRALNRNVFEAWRQGLTNATKTQTLNSLYPQYSVDAPSGGVFDFTKGRPIGDTTPPGSSSNDFNKSWEEFKKNDTSDDSEKIKYDRFKDQYKLSTTQPRNDDRRDFLNRRFS